MVLSTRTASSCKCPTVVSERNIVRFNTDEIRAKEKRLSMSGP